jgi:nucleoside-diphosphate-sugar epimerase
VGRSVLITGSEGHLGRALRAAFEAQGDRVISLDLPITDPDIEIDLDNPMILIFFLKIRHSYLQRKMPHMGSAP